jgi:predicted GNAT family acetyltransferase
MYYTSRRVVENNMREYNNIRTVEYIENQHNVGYVRQYWREIDGEKIIELGADVHPKHRRKGYAKAAYIKLLKNLESACLWVFEDNFARNLYFELGFRDNGKTKINRGRKEYQMIWRRKN